jgi:hypothetical protein
MPRARSTHRLVDIRPDLVLPLPNLACVLVHNHIWAVLILEAGNHRPAVCASGDRGSVKVGESEPCCMCGLQHASHWLIM